MNKTSRMNKMKKLILTGIISIFVISAMLVSVNSQTANNKSDSADGQGVLVNEDSTRSDFSLNVRRNPNGKVVGQASMRNPSFKTGNGQNNLIRIEVSCLKVVGNIAIIGGLAKRKDNQAKAEAMYFAVKDNGGGVGEIFRGFYFDDDESTEGDPQRCESIETDILVLEPIVAGNIQVKGK